MSSGTKNKKTVLMFGNSVPGADSKNLTSAEAIAQVGFGCLITNMDGLEKSRAVTDNPSTYCPHDESIKPRDTDELEISNMTITGQVDYDGASEYQEFYPMADEMINSDTRGVMVLTEPNGTEKIWFEMKFVNVSKVRGEATANQTFKLEILPLTMPKMA